jgi:adenylate kinase
MNIIAVGPPGVGKSTYAQLISKHFNIPIVSVGKMMRAESKKPTKQGRLVKKYVECGDLVPDEIVDKVINHKIAKLKKGFITDGYPRELGQAKLLDSKVDIDVVIFYKAHKKILLERIKNRHKGRVDDLPKIVKERFKVYKEITTPVIKYYKRKKILFEIDASYDYKQINKIIKPSIKAISSAMK